LVLAICLPLIFPVDGDSFVVVLVIFSDISLIKKVFPMIGSYYQCYYRKNYHLLRKLGLHFEEMGFTNVIATYFILLMD